MKLKLTYAKKDVPGRHILFHISLLSFKKVKFISPSLASLEPL